MPVFLDPPVDVTPGTAGVYTDVDVSAHVSGAATGAILRVTNGASVDRSYALRRNGAVDDFYQEIDALAHNGEVVPLDSGGIFEARLRSVSDLTLELVGYFELEAGWPDAPVNVTPGWNPFSYFDVDIAAHTGADTAVSAFLLFEPVGGVLAFARAKGATHSHAADIDNRQPILSGVDNNEVLQAYSESASQRLRLLGWMKDGIVVDAAALEVTPGSAETWTTHALPAGATGAAFWARSTGAGLDWGARMKGSGLDWKANVSERAGFLIVGADENGEVELYAEEVGAAPAIKIYRLGYFVPGDTYNLAIEPAESATELSSFDLTLADNYQLSINSMESATELSSFGITHGIDASPQVIALVALPYDPDIEVTLEGPPAPLGSVAFGETEFSSLGADSEVYASDVGYDSRAGDTPASMPFPHRMKRTASFEARAFAGDRPSGASQEQSGAIVLDNGDGRYDAAALLGFDGRTVELWKGTKARAFRDFTLLLRGTAERVSYDEGSFTIALRDRRATLDRPLNFSLYGGGGGLDGHDGIVGLAKPVALGNLTEDNGNVPAVNIDPVNLVYQLHDGPVQSIDAVRDKGVALAFEADYADYDALIAASIDPGDYGTCVALGIFRLGGSPAGAVTADLQGDAGGSGYVETTAALLRRTVTSRLGAANLSGSELDSLALDALAAAQPAPVGYWAGTAQQSCLAVLDALAGGIGGWHAFDRQGRFTAARLDLSGSAVETLTARETGQRQPAQRSEVAPVWQLRVAWGRAWLVQTADALAGTVSDDDRAHYGQQARYAVAEDSTIRARHRLARSLTVESYFARQSDADSEVARLLALYGPDRDIWTLARAGGRLGRRSLGDRVSLDLGRYGHPKACQVIGVREDFARGEVTLELWG